MASSSGPAFGPRWMAPLLAAGAVAAVAYAFWPETQPPPPPPAAVQPAPTQQAAVADAVPAWPGAGAPLSEWIQAANNLMDHGHFAEAAEGYNHVLQLDSSQVPVWVDRGACRHALGDLHGAESDFRQALTRAPEHPTAHFNLGIVFYSEGRLDSARLHFNYVLAAAPGSNEAERARAILAQQPPK